ncbi:MAG: hypothetical protein IID08_10415, partial [Candidatus Hydrogenedentes bacterium]|nr:hypothetical protein [Candidatus Hydrogenedentota bacterium]
MRDGIFRRRPGSGGFAQAVEQALAAVNAFVLAEAVALVFDADEPVVALLIHD